ncbi:MAG: 2'-5' RNA ligase family protein [Bacteroidia bacterium]
MTPGICKYFIALIPPEPLQSEIMAVKQQISDRFNSKGALRSPAHITLHMPFEWKENKESQLIEALGDFKYGNSPLISLNNYGCFLPRVIFIEVTKNPELLSLQKELVFHIKRRLNIFNQYEDKRGFHPHLTVAFRDLKKASFYEAWAEMKDLQFQAEFKTSSFHLLKLGEHNWKSICEFKLTIE